MRRKANREMCEKEGWAGGGEVRQGVSRLMAGKTLTLSSRQAAGSKLLHKEFSKVRARCETNSAAHVYGYHC